MAFVLSVTILSCSWLMAKYLVSATDDYFSYGKNAEKSQQFGDLVQNRAPWLEQAKQEGKYLSKGQVIDFMNQNDKLSDDELVQSMAELEKEWYFFEWYNDYASSEQYRLNLTSSVLWKGMARLVKDFGFIVGTYLIWLWNLMSGTINWDPRVFLRWLISTVITTVFVAILIPTVSIVIKYVGCSLSIFPQLFRTVLWPIRAKSLSLGIILLPTIFISRSIIHEASLIGVWVEIWIFLVNIVVMWVLLSMIKDASIFIRNKKFIEKVKIWFQE